MIIKGKKETSKRVYEYLKARSKVGFYITVQKFASVNVIRTGKCARKFTDSKCTISKHVRKGFCGTEL